MKCQSNSVRWMAVCFILFCCIFLLTTSNVPAADADPRPNIVVVLVDDLRWDEFGCMGHPFVKTPHIDRIAREGATFSNAFATTPLCSPVRASLLTGLYAHAHGIVDNTNRSQQSHALKTFPIELKRSGYETGYVGKWHMGNDPTPRPGFDYWVSIKGQGRTTDPEIYEDGRLGKVSGYITDIFTDRVVTFIKRPREKPFFVYLAHKAIHPNLVQYDDGSISDPSAAVFVPAARHKGLYADAPIARRANAADNLLGKPALQRTIAGLAPLGPGTGSSDTTIRNRLRMMGAVDDGVGRIVETLEQLGQLDNTVFVVTSDHGYFNGEHGLGVERRLAYEETARIPLLIRYPRLIKPASLVDRLALSIDLAPTLLELSGTDTTNRMHGRSLVPLFRGNTDGWRKSFLIEYYSDTVFPRVLTMGYKAIRTERYKYIHYLELDGMDELYDLKSDPHEMKNLFYDPESQDIVGQMKKELARLLGETE
jgi:N-acetylglucosamine-6-sulfatase